MRAHPGWSPSFAQGVSPLVVEPRPALSFRSLSVPVSRQPPCPVHPRANTGCGQATLPFLLLPFSLGRSGCCQVVGKTGVHMVARVPQVKADKNRPGNKGTWAAEVTRDPFGRKGGTVRTQGHLFQLHLQGVWGSPGKRGLAPLGQQLPIPAPSHPRSWSGALSWGLGHTGQSLQREARGPQLSLSLALPTLRGPRAVCACYRGRRLREGSRGVDPGRREAEGPAGVLGAETAGIAS